MEKLGKHFGNVDPKNIEAQRVPGMMVLLKEDNLLPLSWKLPRIIEVMAGGDGRVRVSK